MNDLQLTFDFNRRDAAAPSGERNVSTISDHVDLPEIPPKNFLRQAVLAYFMELDNNLLCAASLEVSGIRGNIDLAMQSPRNQGGRNSTLIKIFRSREDFAAESAKNEALQLQYQQLLKESAAFEELLKRTEPELCSEAALFSEFEFWDYNKSRNTHYRKLRKKIGKIRNLIFHGTQLNNIVCNKMAEQYFIAAPPEVVSAGEIDAVWGVLHILPDGRVEEIRPAKKCFITPEGLRKLTTAMLRAASDSVQFQYGIRLEGDQVLRCNLPRRRRLIRGNKA